MRPARVARRAAFSFLRSVRLNEPEFCYRTSAPSAGQVEAVQASLSRGPANVNPVHPRHPWTCFRRLFQPFQIGSIAFGDELDCSVIAVAHPTSKTEAIGLPHQEVAETYALDIAANGAV